MRKTVLVMMVVAAFVVVMLAVFGPAAFGHQRLELKTYFQDAKGLREGAPVRLAGVNIGRVKSVRARPEMSQSPAEVVLLISTEYRLNIPNDSTVSLANEGVLGEPFAQIDTRGATGAPAVSGTVLRSRQAETVGAKDFLIDVLEKAVKRCEESRAGAATSNKKSDGHESQR